MIALLDAYRGGLLKSRYWIPNLIAGLIVGIVALPLSMAFAIASGVKPEQGLYTAIIAGLIVGIFGGSRVQIAGPTGAFVVILVGITARYGVDGLQIATLLAGFILLLMGFFRLGSVIKFIPDPVIVGFTAGIGVVIFVSEWKDFLGLKIQHIPLDAHFHTKLLTFIKAFPYLNWPTVILACLSLVLILITPRIFKRIPGPLIAMIIITIIQAFFKFKGVATLGSTFGGITQGLPAFHIPEIHFSKVMGLMGSAFTIALLGAIESLLSATAADGMTGTRHHSNQELIGQGLANILTPLFGGLAATGAIARTATNIRNGGNSPISAIVHAIFLILVIVLLAPLASYIPLCTLAAILIIVAYNMSDIPHFMHIVKHAPRYDVFVLLTTFLLTIFADLVIAVNVGVILAMLFFVRRMNQFVGIKKHTHETLKDELLDRNLPKDTIIYSIQGPFFFGAAEKLERALSITHSDPKKIIFQLKDVPFMDITGLETFKEIIQRFHKREVQVYLCEANENVEEKLEKVGITPLIKKEYIFNTLTETMAHLQKTQ